MVCGYALCIFFAWAPSCLVKAFPCQSRNHSFKSDMLLELQMGGHKNMGCRTGSRSIVWLNATSIRGSFYLHIPGNSLHIKLIMRLKKDMHVNTDTDKHWSGTGKHNRREFNSWSMNHGLWTQRGWVSCVPNQHYSIQNIGHLPICGCYLHSNCLHKTNALSAFGQDLWSKLHLVTEV